MTEQAAQSVVHVLWTGGWDSTYRVLQLVHESAIAIQPHYILDPDRPSSQRELEAIKSVTQGLAQHQPVGHLLSLRVTPLAGIPISDEARRLHAQLVKQYSIGEQYLWLSEYARHAGLAQLELCVHVDDKAYAVVKALREASTTVAPPADNALSLFERFGFPVLEVTKLQMLEAAKLFGFADLMEKTWFCHQPTASGRPCGMCNPCRWTAEEGLSWRLPFCAKLSSLIDARVVSFVPSMRVRKGIRKAIRQLL